MRSTQATNIPKKKPSTHHFVGATVESLTYILNGVLFIYEHDLNNLLLISSTDFSHVKFENFK